MKNLKQLSIAVLCSTGVVVGSQAWAASNQQGDMAKKMAMLEQRANQLDAQLASLRHQMAALQQQSVHRTKPVRHIQARSTPGAVREAPRNLPIEHYRLLGVPVTSSPYLGVRSHFDASDLLVALPSSYEDLRLLQYRHDAAVARDKADLPELNTPHLMLSGKLEAGALLRHPYNSATTSRSDIDLNSAELDLMVAGSPWATGFVALDYDNTGVGGTSQARVANSNVFVHKAFVTLGNLKRSPVYLTLGQYIVPFGHYSSAFVSSPITQAFRNKARAVSLGYARADGLGFYGQGYVFRSQVSINGENHVGDGGLDVGYAFSGPLSGYVGAGVTSNIADGEGLLQSANPGFSGFANAAVNTLNRRVGGMNFHTALNYGHLSLIAEYVGAMRSFDAADMTFNQRPAKPAAFNTELGYSFALGTKPANVSIGYAGTRQALALGLPRQRLGAAFNTSLFKDTIESIEFHHDRNYAASDSVATRTAASVTRPGSVENVLQAQVGFYF